MDHKREAERLLALLATETNDAAWHLVMATRALAHASLAGLAEPIRPALHGVVDWEPPPQYCSTDRDMEPVIVFQGAAVQDPVHWRTADGREHTA